ncbi:hypothetical protein MUK42_03042 [Musa troglodytarum]|uniref:Uncharacterized protein n=1 Tax=Musa troglodytarum TaxID=320322 RepID=A0A9E7FUJ0_9LILI|nr:hypothetical protein MUK42_03042 [Musa troglodytarum]
MSCALLQSLFDILLNLSYKNIVLCLPHASFLGMSAEADREDPLSLTLRPKSFKANINLNSICIQVALANLLRIRRSTGSLALANLSTLHHLPNPLGKNAVLLEWRGPQERTRRAL